tara:strand:- start:228 stop:407 length:180 start_codon:yes stop_codon:yes gene_type:complete
MKIFLTEVLKDNKMLVGPYIQAEDIEEAIEIADMYALTVIGELYELNHTTPVKEQKVVH